MSVKFEIEQTGNESGLWHLYAETDCKYGPEKSLLADILEPMTENPGWRFHFPFGMKGILDAITFFLQYRFSILTHENN